MAAMASNFKNSNCSKHTFVEMLVNADFSVHETRETHV